LLKYCTQVLLSIALKLFLVPAGHIKAQRAIKETSTYVQYFTNTYHQYLSAVLMKYL
jgi:hypothetical protein